MTERDPASIEPTRIESFPNSEIGVVWADGHESYFRGYDLRCACTCAMCVEETTGRPLLDRTTVPRDVRAEEIHRVGRYGIGIRWSDGHDTGIYAFTRLRAIDEGTDEHA